MKAESAHSKNATVAGDDSQLVAAIDEYLAAAERGEAPLREEFLARFPQHAHDLRQCLESLDFIGGAAPAYAATNSSLPIEQQQLRKFQLGDFQLLQEIGRGGMGIVYEAEQLSLGRRVAVKVLPFAALLDRRQLERFKNEARAAAMLKHPNIVSVYSVGTERGVHYYAMELIEGLSLAEISTVANDGGRGGRARMALESNTSDDTAPIAALSTARDQDRRQFYRNVARIGVQAARALDFAHSRGVVHRDVKPSNLLLDAEGNVHVADFGLAQIHAQSELTMAGDLVGTLRYMSPEQRSDETAPDQRTDVYSLGLTLYELATGHAAFDATGREQLLRQLADGQPPPPGRWDRAFPRDVEKIIAKAIASRPDERYQSAGALADDLSRFLDGAPVVARPIGRLKRTWRWCLRNRAKAALVGLVSALLLTLAIGGPVAAVHQAATAARQRHEAYDRDMARANMYVEHGEIAQAVKLLREYLPERDGGANDYRSFEYYELVKQCERRLEATEIRHETPCWGLAISPTGDVAAGTHFLGPIVYDGVSGQRKWPPLDVDNSASAATGLAYSPDGRFLLATSRDNTLRVWDTKARQRIYVADLDFRPSSVAVSADGMVAVGTWGKVKQGFPQSDPAAILRFQLVESTGGDATELTVKLAPLPPLRGAVGVARTVVFSPDGQRAAAGSEDGVLRVWNVTTGEIEAEFADFRGPVMAAAFSPDGSKVSGGGGDYRQRWLSGEAIVYDVERQAQVTAVFPEHAVYAVAFRSDRQLATGGIDRRISVWNIADGALQEEINAHSDAVLRLAVFPAQKRIASAGQDGAVRIWDMEAPAPPMRLGVVEPMVDVVDLACSPDSARLASASGDRAVRLWDPQQGKLLQVLGRHEFAANGVDFSPDGKQLASIASDWPAAPGSGSELKIWDLADGEATTYLIDDLVYGRSLAYAPSGAHLAVVGGDRLILWNVSQERIERESKTEPGIRVVFSQDGALIASASGLWTYPALEKLWSFPKPVDRVHYAFDVHPSNKYVAATDLETHDVVLFDAQTGAELQRLAGHNEIVLHLDFSHDGRRLASASLAGVVIIWNLETGGEIIRYRDHKFWVWSALFSPGDRFLASSQGGRFLPPTIFLRRTATPEQTRRLLERR